jgi:hypothetical protein
MATRSNIGIMNEDGSIRSIYCHWNGYPEHHVPILTQHYATQDQAEELVALGNLSCLGTSIGEKHDFDKDRGKARELGWCMAYGRDRGEEEQQAETHANLDLLSKDGEEYVYVYKAGQWWLAEDGRLVSAADVLEGIIREQS